MTPGVITGGTGINPAPEALSGCTGQIDIFYRFIYLNACADLISACGRVINTAKERQPALANADAGFFTFSITRIIHLATHGLALLQC